MISCKRIGIPLQIRVFCLSHMGATMGAERNRSKIAPVGQSLRRRSSSRNALLEKGFKAALAAEMGGGAAVS